MPSWLTKVPSWLRKNALCLSQSAFSKFAPHVIRLKTRKFYACATFFITFKVSHCVPSSECEQKQKLNKIKLQRSGSEVSFASQIRFFYPYTLKKPIYQWETLSGNFSVTAFCRNITFKRLVQAQSWTPFDDARKQPITGNRHRTFSS